MPGVLSVGAISHLPMSGRSAGRGFSIEGRPAEGDDEPGAAYRLVCPGYFATLGIPLRSGRHFDRRDGVDAPGSVIVNEALARRYWPGEDPVGRRLKLGGPGSPAPWLTVLGVVGDVRHFGFDEPARPELFRPYSQAAWPALTIVARTGPEPGSLAETVRRAAFTIDRDLPITQVQTMEEWMEDSLGPRRFPMQLLGAFSLFACWRRSASSR